MTTRESIVDAIVSRMQGITAFGNRVYPWRVAPVTPAMCPCCIVRDESDTITALGVGASYHNLSVTISVLASGATAADSLRDLSASVVAAIGTDDRWSETAAGTSVVSMEMEVEQTEHTLGAMTITLSVLYRTAVWSL